MKKNVVISLVIAVIVFALVLFFVADSNICTDISKEACFNSTLFHPTLLIIAFIIGIIAFLISYFLTKRFNSSS